MLHIGWLGCANTFDSYQSLPAAISGLHMNGSPCFLQVSMKVYDGETHTSPLVENPMRGGTDKLMDDVLSMVKGQEVVTVQYSLCPGFLVSLAAWVCPF